MSEIEENQDLPTAQDVAARLIILHHVALAPRMLMTNTSRYGLMNSAEGEKEKISDFLNAQRDSFWSKLRQWGLWEFMAPSELELAKANGATMTDMQITNASWRAEALHVLAWTLGLIERIEPYDVAVKPWLLEQNIDLKEFIAKAVLRDQEEIEAARELAEFWNWRNRTRQLIESGEKLVVDQQVIEAGFSTYDDIVRASAKIGLADGDLPQTIDDDFVAFGKAYRDLSDEEWSIVRSITIERHYGLNWVRGYATNNEWDETETPT